MTQRGRTQAGKAGPRGFLLRELFLPLRFDRGAMMSAWDEEKACSQFLQALAGSPPVPQSGTGSGATFSFCYFFFIAAEMANYLGPHQPANAVFRS